MFPSSRAGRRDCVAAALLSGLGSSMRLSSALILVAASAVVVLASLAACDDRRGRDEAPSTGTPSTGLTPTAHEAVQLGAFADSLTAAALRDSLAAAGWNAYLRELRQGGRSLWRVRLAVGNDPDVARLTAFVLRARGDTTARLVMDTSALTGARALEVTRVNRSVHGMLALTRWALSPDGRTVLAVEDPAGVENEPLPNGFVFASERDMRRVQVDSVWDVSPAPGWRTAAFGKGYRMSAGEHETLSTAQWRSFADRIGMPVRDVRRGAFSVSGMAYIFGFARPGVVDLETGDVQLFSVAGGWRVGWSQDGSRLLLGSDPARVENDAPATTWFAIDPTTGQPLGHYQTAPAMAHVNWNRGPLLDISVQPDTASRIALPIEGGSVESRSGWIRARGRIIGPGVVLAATRGGRFVVALAPNPDAGEYDAKEMLVVYTLSR
jgi:hypothetical protein